MILRNCISSSSLWRRLSISPKPIILVSGPARGGMMSLYKQQSCKRSLVIDDRLLYAEMAYAEMA